MKQSQFGHKKFGTEQHKMKFYMQKDNVLNYSFLHDKTDPFITYFWETCTEHNEQHFPTLKCKP